MFIWKDMWKGRPPKSPQVAAARRRFFLALHDLPKTGWACEGVHDAGGRQCWVCGMPIRYRHQVRHWQVVDEDSGLTVDLEIGCECAGAVTGHGDQAKAREREARNRATRRRRWLDRAWNVSRRGNLYLRTKGWHVVVFPAPGSRWNYRVQKVDPLYPLYHGRPEWEPVFGAGYATQDAAKLAAFDHLNPVTSYPPTDDPLAERLWMLNRVDPFLAQQEMRQARVEREPARVVRAMEQYLELL